MKSFKSQSAMEYLMTYGWAILIVAVVLGALFGLGFFNSASLAPKVSPGSCQVYRPDGPGTTTFINTEGTCNNELPQYVAQFNGHSSNIVASSIASLSGGNSKTVSLWYETSYTVNDQGLFDLGLCNINYQAFQFFIAGQNDIGVSGSYPLTNPGGLYFAGWGDDVYVPLGISAVANRNWDNVVVTYNGGNSQLAVYFNGALYNAYLWTSSWSSLSQQPITITSLNTPISAVEIGESRCTLWATGTQYFYGSVSDFQVYNTSLSANEVAALYQEGVGGDPVDTNYLVGWWPLNGNANDYSGNLNNGIPTNVIYTSSWTNGYSAP